MTISPTARIPGEAKAPGIAPALLGTSAPAKNLKLSKICGCAIMILKFKVYKGCFMICYTKDLRKSYSIC